jgi:hypothetical protein
MALMCHFGRSGDLLWHNLKDARVLRTAIAKSLPDARLEETISKRKQPLRGAGCAGAAFNGATTMLNVCRQPNIYGSFALPSFAHWQLERLFNIFGPGGVFRCAGIDTAREPVPLQRVSQSRQMLSFSRSKLLEFELD